MAKVIRVFGKADNFDIELAQNGDKWEVDVPPDMVDGVYAVQLTAIDVLNEVAYWVGELYMTNGVCCLSLRSMPYEVDVDYNNKYNIRIISKDYETTWQCPKYLVSNYNHYEVEISKPHKCHRCRAVPSR